jgi:hypothetical protein
MSVSLLKKMISIQGTSFVNWMVQRVFFLDLDDSSVAGFIL